MAHGTLHPTASSVKLRDTNSQRSPHYRLNNSLSHNAAESISLDREQRLHCLKRSLCQSLTLLVTPQPRTHSITHSHTHPQVVGHNHSV